MELDVEALQMLPADESGLQQKIVCTFTCSNGVTCTVTISTHIR